MTGATNAVGLSTARQRVLQDATVVAALTVAWLVATAWARPLMLPDEGRYVGVAWEMLRSGDWLTPTLNGLPYFHKPPLFYWITAASMSVFGPHPWAARAAPMLGACLGALALYAFARRWASERAARATVLVLLVQPLFYLGGQFANLDMLVAGCICATILLLAHASLSAERGLDFRAARESAYALAALGVLAKGLIGAVLPVMVIVAWLVLRRRWPDLRALVSWRGAVLFAVLACPWFLAMQWRFSDFLDYFFVVQHFKRYATSGFNNAQPFWFYPVVLTVFSLPFVPWLRPAFSRGYFKDPERGPVRLLMLAWIVVVVAFFSLPRSKLLGYVLPAVPPLAYLVADAYLSLVSPSPRTAQRWRAGIGVAALVSLGAVVFLAMRPGHSTRELAAVLGEQRGPGEPVYMINDYYFDVPVYARLPSPVRVVDDWANPEVRRRDNWRKELADAGLFAVAQAQSFLLAPSSLVASLCGSPVSWVMGPASAADTQPFLRRAQAVSSQRGTTLWRVATSAPGLSGELRCPGTPNADSPGK
jgi:4-amino-4-deoxy-L-arabinose transferase-like glycosyltransferase